MRHLYIVTTIFLRTNIARKYAKVETATKVLIHCNVEKDLYATEMVSP